MPNEIKRADPPSRERWKFFNTLEVGYCFEEKDASNYVALRTAASRYGKRLKRTFSVRKERTKGRSVVRVYRTE